MTSLYQLREDICWRRFGRNHDKPCARPNVLTCASWECQERNRCVDLSEHEEKRLIASGKP